MTDSSDRAEQRHLAFYLPQFHPIPENDEWWGPGFTEWLNVARARPLFSGHLQPHLPADLGFYDLRLPETRQLQANMAREHGIDGFVYYHYWFGGRQLLERPFAEVLATGTPDFPFSLCWANESWTRAWDGRTDDVLIEQVYDDDRQHATWLAQVFKDPRYIRVDGKPLFLVYRASDLPDPRSTLAVIREEALRAGVGELHICRVESFPDDHSDPYPLGFDAAVEFAPDWTAFHPGLRAKARSGLRRLGKTARKAPWQLYDYGTIAGRMQSKPPVPYRRYRCVTPRWDNTPRKGHRGLALTGSDPGLYADWVAWATRDAQQAPETESLVFVNAWNEWGEGAHLEPCVAWGRAYLEAHLEGRNRGLNAG